MWRRSGGASAAGCVGARVLVFTSQVLYDLVCGFGGVVGESGFSGRFAGLMDRYGRVGCGLDVVRRTACLGVGPVVVGGFASLFGCAAAVWASGSMTASS